MPLVSITRFRARAFWFVPMLMHHAQRSISQIRSAKGCISMALLQEAQADLPVLRARYALVGAGTPLVCSARGPTNSFGERIRTADSCN
jgi:hypothetical protein